MGETVIIIDTNQFRSSPMLRSEPWADLFAKAEDWGLRFVVPEVCFREAVSVVRRKWADDRLSVERLQLGEFGMNGAQQEIIDAITAKIDGYEEALRTRLVDEMGVQIRSLPESANLDEVMQRAIDRRKPYPDGVGTKDGFRDTLIWYTTLDVALADSDCEVWLVSTNHNDFGDRSSKEVREACPHPLHPHLVEDLAAGELSGRVQYVRTIDRLAQRLASTYNALPPNEQQELFARMDRGEFARRIEGPLLQVELRARAAALPVRTVMATIQSFTADADSLDLVDAALRGGGTWTAQYCLTIVALVDLVDRDGNTLTLEKTLNVAGRLVGAIDGSISNLVVATIEAPEDDSMRRAWDLPPIAFLDPVIAQRDWMIGTQYDPLKSYREAMGGYDPLEQMRKNAGGRIDPLEQVRNAAASIQFDPLEHVRKAAAAGFDPLEQVRNAAASIQFDPLEHVRKAAAAGFDPLEQVRNAAASIQFDPLKSYREAMGGPGTPQGTTAAEEAADDLPTLSKETAHGDTPSRPEAD